MASFLSQTELFTLVAIARLEDSAYGVSIREEIHQFSGRDVSMAGVYDALERLERRGWVRAWLSEPRAERGGRARRHYGLTSSGRAFVRSERENALRMWRGVPADAIGRR